MAAEYSLALDAGNGGGRALLLRLEDGAAFSAWRAWQHRPAAAPGGRDLDLDAVWRALGATTRDVLARAGARPEQVIGIAATSLRHGLVALDKRGLPVYAAPTADARAIAEGMRLAAERGAELHARTGRWPGPVFGAARLLWLDAHLPGGLGEVEIAFALSDWIAWRLCGARATDRTHACETLLLDLDAGKWAHDLAESLHIPSRLLAPLVEPGTRLGGLTAQAAQELGLVAGTPVAAGGADTSAGLLGLAAIDPGDAAAIVGTSAPLQLVVARAVRDRRVWAGRHLLASRGFVLESVMGVMGEVLEFAGRLLFPDATQPAARLLAEADDSEPGARGMLSSVGAEVTNAAEFTLPIGALWLSHLSAAGDPDARRHAARAIAEGMVFALRANLEQLEGIAGRRAGSLRLGGGMSRSQVFARLAAAALDRPVQVGAVAESSALGAALCAACGAGRFGDPAQAARALVRLREVAPEPALAAAYAELYPVWSRLRAARAEADAIARQHAIGALVRAGAGSTRPRPARAPRILVTADLDPAALEQLRELGPVEHASYRERKRILARDALVQALGGFQIFVTEIDLVDADSLARLPELRVVASCRGNAVNVDVAACSAFGVPVINAPGRNAHAVADLALAFMLMLARRLVAADRFLHQPHEPGDTARMGGAYAQLRGDELWDRTVGLVGIGAVGREVARRVRACGARVLAFDPFVSDEVALRAGAERVDLDELMSRSDFISLHAAVTPASRGLIGAQQLARARPSAFLINTARAALVDEAALADALREGRLAGAAIDTFSVEPPGSAHPLLQLPNVISAPHVGGNTRQVSIHQGRIVARALAALLAGERPRELLNPEALDGLDWSRPRREVDADTLARLRAAPGPAVTDLQKG